MPENISVIRTAGFGLDEIAARTVEAWRFEPGSQAGKDTRSPVNIELNFRNADKSHAGQIARLNFDLPPGVARPVLVEGKIPPNPEPVASAFLNIRVTVSPDGTAGNFKTLQSDIIRNGRRVSWNRWLAGASAPPIRRSMAFLS